MNCFEEEPRKVPKPIPFAQNSPLHPAVPEVSLILQDASSSANAGINSFSGTEFQTYNAWRWKTINDREKENLMKKNEKEIFYPIQDKFSGSEIERRKNEILYGSPNEPRRPLPPRPAPVIPDCMGTSFSDISMNDQDDIYSTDKFLKPSATNHFQMNRHENKKSEVKCNDDNDIKDLYMIISEQNKQMSFLQKQIEQLLKSQDTKEKQIEQLLKSQETKECKIEQLLKMQDMKEKHIEQLLKAQEKHEKQIEQLIHTQQKTELKKDVCSVGVMTLINVNDKGTNTDGIFICKCKGMAGSIKVNAADTMSSIDCPRFASGEKSLTFNSLELPVIQEHIPTPQSSIHVDIPEFIGSSDEESDTSSSIKEMQVPYLSDSKPLGYTFYNNILTQVNDIIQNHEDKENRPVQSQKDNFHLEQKDLHKYTCLKEHNAQVMNPPFANGVENVWCVNKESVEVQHYKKMPGCSLKGIAETSLQPYNEISKETQSPSDISLKMNALALKYLKEEQISQYQIHSQGQPSGRQPDVTIYNVTNLSFGTMRYLERHQMTNENKHPKHYNSQQQYHYQYKGRR